MNPAIQHFPRTAHQPRDCQECVELRAEVEALRVVNAELRHQVERLTHAVHRDAGDLYDKRADKHDKPLWTYLTQGKPAGRSGDVK